MPSPLQLLVCSEADADLYAYRRGREAGVTVRIIRGKRCSSLDRCMGELAAALQLPYCFENTWESLRQSLPDIRWGSSTQVVLLLTEIHRVLPRSNADFAQMLGILQEHAQSQAMPLSIVLHTDNPHRDGVQERLRTLELNAEPIAL